MKYMYCTFRLDDITPDMDWPRFNKIRDIFDKHNVKPLIGVVPDNRDKKLMISEPCPAFWKTLKAMEAEGWTIAQHGYQHLYVTNKSGMLKMNSRSEFAGLTFAEQVEKISKGKKLLENQQIYTDIFMAPAHSYDRNTLKALKYCGFKYVTDGYTRYPYDYMGIKFIPCMHVLPKKTKGIVTSCIHSNSTKEEIFTEVDYFIKNNRGHVIDFRQALEIKSTNSARIMEGYYIVLYQIKKNTPPYLRKIIKKLILK